MEMIVCDLCGGKIIIGANGTATCEGCGIEYSLERMKEKYQELHGIKSVDNSKKIENYLELAESAYDANNLTEAESYANRILEVEPQNYVAWIIKGKSAGWQSDQQNNRVMESAVAFSKAITNAPQDVKEQITDELVNELRNLLIKMVSFQGEKFAKRPKDAGTDKKKFSKDIAAGYSAVEKFVKQSGADISFEELLEPIIQSVNQFVSYAYDNIILQDYQHPCFDKWRALEYEWKSFIEYSDFCVELILQAIELCDEAYKAKIKGYEKIISIQRNAVSSSGWEKTLDDECRENWNRKFKLAGNELGKRRKDIEMYQVKIRELEYAFEMKIRNDKQKRIDAYWAQHESEKASLIKEQSSLRAEIDKLSAQIAENDEIVAKKIAELKKERDKKLPQEVAYEKQEAIIIEFERQKQSLGLFMIKEKKNLQKKIEQEILKLENLKRVAEVAKEEQQNRLKEQISINIANNESCHLKEELADLRSRDNIITEELTKDR